jgi:hypothetical protein
MPAKEVRANYKLILLSIFSFDTLKVEEEYGD